MHWPMLQCVSRFHATPAPPSDGSTPQKSSHLTVGASKPADALEIVAMGALPRSRVADRRWRRTNLSGTYSRWVEAVLYLLTPAPVYNIPYLLHLCTRTWNCCDCKVRLLILFLCLDVGTIYVFILERKMGNGFFFGGRYI